MEGEEVKVIGNSGICNDERQPNGEDVEGRTRSPGGDAYLLPAASPVLDIISSLQFKLLAQNVRPRVITSKVVASQMGQNRCNSSPNAVIAVAVFGFIWPLFRSFEVNIIVGFLRVKDGIFVAIAEVRRRLLIF